MTSKALFLDRDGVINQKPPDHHYVTSVSELILLPGIEQAIHRAKAAGFLIIVVTNQRGISRGHFTEEILSQIHTHINSHLQKHQAAIDAFYYCHHDYHHQCDCRKPRPGLILKAAKDFRIDLSHSHLIGDSPSDIQAAAAAGIPSAHLIPPNSPLLPQVLKILQP